MLLCQMIEAIFCKGESSRAGWFISALAPSAALVTMHYNEILGRRIVAEVARPSVDGGALPPVLLHEVVCRLKIDEAWAESAVYRAAAERCHAG